ncbi:MAG: ferritin [Bdellovibrionales bacterium]|nr:ferritin [Bdellovibrionales bacterium]
MIDLLNKHLNVELFAAYQYLAISAYCHSINMNGAAKWMQLQSQEELMHAMKFYNFINDREGRIVLEPIKQPKTEFSSLLEAFEAALGHERHVTSEIHNLVAEALERKDHATHTFLQWFVTEQLEEEATVVEIVQSLKLVGDNGHGLLMIDRELGSRSAATAG